MAIQVNPGTSPAEQDISVLVRMSGAQTINNNTVTTVLWGTEVYDTDDMHDTGANTERLVAPITGKYHVTLNILWEADAGAVGVRTIYIRDSAAGGLARSDILPYTTAIGQIASCTINLSANDYVYAQVYQNSGGGLDILLNNVSNFSMEHIAEVQQ